MTTTALAPQTVTSLVVEQFKRVTDVEIIPDTDTPTVQITGRNAQGKSSVLDALEAVFTGLDKRKTPRPIHEGKAAARIVAETQDLVITRTFYDKNDTVKTALTVTAQDGAKYGSPQKMLDELFGQVTVDPWAFATMPAKDQRATLLSLVDLPFDLDALDRKRAELFARRTEENREAKSLTTQLDAIQNQLPQDGANTQETSAGDLIQRIQTAQIMERDLADAKRNVQQWKTSNEEAAERIRQLQQELAQDIVREANAEKRVADLEELGHEDADELTAQLTTVEETNREARANAQAFARAEALEAAEQDAAHKAAETDLAIRDIDKRKAEGLAKAEFPVPGLAFTEDGITYQGQPFEQASTAEKIRVSFAVATAKPGKIRVVMIRNGEALDRDNLALIGELAAEAGFQVWVERVSEVRELGVFLLEDGKLAE